MRVHIEAQIMSGVNSSKYFIDLIDLAQQDQKCKVQARLEAILLEGIDSQGREATPEYWQNLRSTVLDKNSGKPE
mgnify:FL=1